FFSILD
ncbi:Soluble interferon-gamma receptor-like protein, partial [Monkeypox virus]